ncbi:MAG TPA: class I SAM-dependent methyltransferase [Gemmataceae bacterium]
MPKSLLPDPVANYVCDVMTPETPVQRRLRQETAELPRGRMQVSPDQAAFLAWLVRVTGVRAALEVGTFTGYSGLAVAAALPPGGRLVCCDVSEEWTAVARRYWREAGVADRIDLRLGPAVDTLAGLLRGGSAGAFDLAFIDADKENSDAYYEACLGLVRPGGVIVIDNALWHGAVADPAADDAETAAIRALNLRVRDDARVDACLLAVGDGLLMARRR